MSKVWLVTGSARGLGREITAAALAAGDQVLATARKPQQLDDLKPRHRDRIQPSRSTSPTPRPSTRRARILPYRWLRRDDRWR